VHQAEKTYRNKDTFLDLPLLTRISDFNKWKYANENEGGWFSQTGIRFKGKQCIGGQVFFNAVNHQGSTQVFGQKVPLAHA
jgi:hypothetical protein